MPRRGLPGPEDGPQQRGTCGGIMDTGVDRDRFCEMFKGRSVVVSELPAGHSRVLASMANEMAARAIEDYARASLGQQEFFAADMYMVQVTGFRPGRGVLTEPVRPGRGARVDVWKTDPADDRHIPAPDRGGALFSSQAFCIKNSGNHTLRAPKRSWRIILDAAGPDNRLAGMRRLNLKAMWNDPAQMREALAWRLFGLADVPAPRHTYAKFAFGSTYRGLFNVIEQVDRRFLKDRFGENHLGNLYKTGCRDIGCATLAYRTGPDGDDSGRQYYVPGAAEHTYRLKTNADNPEANTYDDLACLIRTINGVGLPGVGGPQHAARELGQLLRHAVELLPLQLGAPGSRQGLRRLALFPLHPVGLRQLPGDRLFRHPVAVRRHPRLGGQHAALLEEPEDHAHPARAEPAPQPRLPPVLPGLSGAHARHRIQPAGVRHADRDALARRPVAAHPAGGLP